MSHAMLKPYWAACAGMLLLLFGCEDTKTPRCVPGESVACLGAGQCEGSKVCDTNGLVFGSCQCSLGSAGSAPPGSRSAPAAACVPGATRVCLDGNGCTGVATCGDSGTFSACQCPTPPSRVPALQANVLGARCLGNAQCGSSLVCWAASETGPGALGGAAAGYCTAPCQKTADCTLFEQPGDCVQFAGATYGVCLASCTSSAGEAPEASCGRSDLACATYTALSLATPDPAAPERGLCVPHCSSDAECGARSCDLAQPVATCVGGPDAGADGGP
jgi:hypothetical protein